MTLSRNLAIALATLGLLAPCASAGTINYAQGKPATASAVYRGDFAIEFGNDGLLNTFWNSGRPAAWWQVDLEAIVTIDDIVVFNSNGPGLHTTFQLSSSTDGSTWSPVGAPTTGSGLALYSRSPPTVRRCATSATPLSLMNLGPTGARSLSYRPFKARVRLPNRPPSCSLAPVSLRWVSLAASASDNSLPGSVSQVGPSSYSQPFWRAMRAASVRLAAPSLLMASER